MINKSEGRRILKGLSAIISNRADAEALIVVNELAEFISTIPNEAPEMDPATEESSDPDAA